MASTKFDGYNRRNSSNIFGTSNVKLNPSPIKLAPLAVIKETGFKDDKSHKMKFNTAEKSYSKPTNSSHLCKSGATTEFKPTFKDEDETAFNRKIKEFYLTEFTNSNDKTKTFGEINRKKIQESISSSFVELNPKERKFLELNPSMNAEDVKKFSSKEQTIEKNNHYKDKDSKSIKVESLKSNIFNDPYREETYEKFTGSFHEEKPPPKDKVKATVPKNNWKAKIDWKDANNEILFHKFYEIKAESANERKLNDLKDHFDETRSNLKAPPQASEQAIIADDKQLIKNCLFTDNQLPDNKLRKTMDLASAFQGKDFYETVSKCSGKINRPVSSYEVNGIKDFDSLKIKEIESHFKRRGIHIYDVKATGSYVNGNTNGNFSFKIRENTDEKDFSKKISEVKELLKCKMDIEVAPRNITKKKTASIGCLPSNLKWDETQIHNYVKNNKTFDKTNYETNKLNLSSNEKISKSYNPTIISYKNMKGLKTVQKK